MVKRGKEVNSTLEQAMKPQRGSRGIAVLFLSLRRYVGVGGQRHTRAALPPGKRPVTHCIGGYLLTPWSRAPLEKLTGSAASQEIPRIFGTRRFLTVLTSARHLSLS